MKQKTWKYAPIIQLDTTNQAQTFSGTHLNMKSICIFWTFTLDCTFELQPDALGKDKNKLVFWNSEKKTKKNQNEQDDSRASVHRKKRLIFFFIECTFETCSIWIFVFNICLQYTHWTHPLSFLSIIVFTFCSWYVFLDMYAPAHNEAVAVFYLLHTGKFQCVLCKCTHIHKHKHLCVFQMISLELLSCCFQPFVGISFFTKFVPMSNTQYGSTCTW